MPSKLMYGRDPFPYPRPENDDDFVGHTRSKSCSQSSPLHIAQKTDPWNRLSVTPTLQSSRREVYYQDPMAPSDSLDFILKSVYKHDRDFLKEKPKVVKQKETTGEELGRKLKNREKTIAKTPPPMNHPLQIAGSGKMEDFNSVKLAIGPQPKCGSGGVFGRKPKLNKNNKNTKAKD